MSSPRPPEPDANHILTQADAALAGYDLNAEIARLLASDTPITLPEDVVKSIWVGDYTKPIPVELDPEYHAVPYTPPAATFFPPLMGRIEETMRERLSDLYGAR